METYFQRQMWLLYLGGNLNPILYFQIRADLLGRFCLSLKEKGFLSSTKNV